MSSGVHAALALGTGVVLGATVARLWSEDRGEGKAAQPDAADAGDELSRLRRQLELNRLTDDELEECMVNRVPLQETLRRLLPLLHAGVSGSYTTFVRTFDENLALRDFDAFPETLPASLAKLSDIQLITASEGDFFSSGRGFTTLAQRIDVSGEDFGCAGVVLRGERSREEVQRDKELLYTWCEVLDNHLHSISESRRKHHLTNHLSFALRHPALHTGVVDAVRVLFDNVSDIDTLVCVYRHDVPSQKGNKEPCTVVKVFQGPHSPTLVSDSEQGYSKPEVVIEGNLLLKGNFGPFCKRFGITSYWEHDMVLQVWTSDNHHLLTPRHCHHAHETGHRRHHRHADGVPLTSSGSGNLLGRVLVSKQSQGKFNTHDSELLERFVDFLRQVRKNTLLFLCNFYVTTVRELTNRVFFQRVMDYNRMWHFLAGSFSRPTVSRLLWDGNALEHLAVQEKNCAVMFCDISGSSLSVAFVYLPRLFFSSNIQILEFTS
jgi:hypothetical protein